ncbi:MAG: class I SAM-dependent methyltransferase, partial [Candidatus Eisenbacteria bacterium]|nr:class I SAM-dependent methyltransferase [Candidatus Eisenbacteria bacterium]
MTYRPREFWEQRLSEQFDLRGTGETGLSLAYNRACYALRGETLDRALAVQGLDPRGRRVL